mgnify:FL=1
MLGAGMGAGSQLCVMPGLNGQLYMCNTVLSLSAMQGTCVVVSLSTYNVGINLSLLPELINKKIISYYDKPSQNVPVYPGWHTQTNPLTLSSQTCGAEQGLLSHSFSSISHWSPTNPSGQEQIYPLTRSWHSVPFAVQTLSPFSSKQSSMSVRNEDVKWVTMAERLDPKNYYRVSWKNTLNHKICSYRLNQWNGLSGIVQN